MCVLSIKVPIRKKKAGNLFNDPRKYPGLAKKLKKQIMEYESDGDNNCALGTIIKGLVKGLEDLEIKRHLETIKTTAF